MEKINHPTHYNIPGKKECIEQMLEDYGIEITMIFCLTNAYKYIYRAGNKAGESETEDMEKARWYYRWIKAKMSELIKTDKTGYPELRSDRFNKGRADLLEYVRKELRE